MISCMIDRVIYYDFFPRNKCYVMIVFMAPLRRDFLSLERVTYHRFTLRLRTVNTQADGRRKWRWMIARLVVGMGREARVTTWSRRSKDIRSIVVVLLFLLALFSAPVVQNVYVYTCICIYICMYVWNQISPYSLLDRNWQVKPQIRTFTFHTSVRLSFGSVILFPELQSYRWWWLSFFKRRL